MEREKELEMREQQRAGTIAAVVANGMGAKRVMMPHDFFPMLPQPHRVTQSPEEVAEIMRAFGRHIRPNVEH